MKHQLYKTLREDWVEAHTFHTMYSSVLLFSYAVLTRKKVFFNIFFLIILCFHTRSRPFVRISRAFLWPAKKYELFYSFILHMLNFLFFLTSQLCHFSAMSVRAIHSFWEEQVAAATMSQNSLALRSMTDA